MKQLSVDEFEAFCRDNPRALSINLHPQEEYAKGHLPNSVNVPLECADFIHKISSLAPDKEQPIILYSETESSAESMNAAQQLIEAGYNNVMNFSGGMHHWTNTGKNIEKEP